MRHSLNQQARSIAAGLAVALFVGLIAADESWAFVLPNGSNNANTARWQVTASGSTGTAGDPVTLTWSIVPDGTLTRDNPQSLSSEAPSDLIAKLDAEFGAGPGGTDYTLRPWFTYLQQSFDRWEALSGVDYVYEPNDDGITHGFLPSNQTFDGQTGLRGDIRISGVGIDGDLGGLAYNFFPAQGGDLAFDTDDVDNYFGDADDDFLNFRYTATHELGHGLGLDHTLSNSAAFLMEATTNAGIDGPQHDDLRGVHWLYGDALEKTNGGAGNNSSGNAYPLGALAFGSPLSVGADGDGVSVAPGETDFVSIDRATDVDFFSFTVAAPTTIDVLLTPRGAQFDQNGQAFDTTATSDLSLTLVDANGSSTLVSASPQPAGVVESIVAFDIEDPGQYYVRAGGSDPIVQFYQVDLIALPDLLGDYNGDGVVDAADYTVYRTAVGQNVTPYTGADGDGDGVVGAGDYAVWASRLGDVLPSSVSVPEPQAVLMGLIAAAFWSYRVRLF